MRPLDMRIFHSPQLRLRILLLSLLSVLGLSTLVRGQRTEDPRQGYTFYTFRQKFPALWDHWSHWEPCSRTCGEGVAMRTRRCLMWSGERYMETHLTACTGYNIDYKLCNERACPPGTPEYREHQCKMLDTVLYGGNYKWMPYHGGKPCDLNCQAVGRNFVYNFGQVQDGTRCPPNGVCIKAQCVALGCDGQMGSSTREDMCGVCGGRNDTCTRIHRTFTDKYPRADSRDTGYGMVVTIPRGARHFRVEDNSRNQLAVMGRSSRKFVTNGNYMRSPSGEYRVGSTRFIYSRDGDLQEQITGEGPTTDEMDILLFYREHNRGVTYEYWRPRLPYDVVRDQASPVTSPPPVEDFRTSPTPDPGTTRKTTLSESQIWSLVMDGLENGGDKVSSKPSDANDARPRDRGRRRGQGRRQNRPRADRNGRRSNRARGGFRSKEMCGPCQTVKNAKKNFCKSDFVASMRILGRAAVNGTTRYDVQVVETFRSSMPLMSREFVWTPNLCKCPRLRVAKEYVVMGYLSNHNSREIRLTVDTSSFVRKFSEKIEKRMEKLQYRAKCKS